MDSQPLPHSSPSSPFCLLQLVASRSSGWKRRHPPLLGVRCSPSNPPPSRQWRKPPPRLQSAPRQQRRFPQQGTRRRFPLPPPSSPAESLLRWTSRTSWTALMSSLSGRSMAGRPVEELGTARTTPTWNSSGMTWRTPIHYRPSPRPTMSLNWKKSCWTMATLPATHSSACMALRIPMNFRLETGCCLPCRPTRTSGATVQTVTGADIS